MFNITLKRVHDTVRISEGAEQLILKVEADPNRMVVGLSEAQKLLKAAGEDPDKLDEASNYFSSVIFGKEQAQKLSDFYHGDPGCVISVCGRYFAARLNKLITKAQKKGLLKK